MTKQEMQELTEKTLRNLAEIAQLHGYDIFKDKKISRLIFDCYKEGMKAALKIYRGEYR